MEFEYVIVGSGVAGAVVAARILSANRSATVAVIEAGAPVVLKDRRAWWDFISTGVNPYDQFHDRSLPAENLSVGDESWTFRESRLMGRGGSTVHWGGWVLRFKEEDFETFSRTGRGADWPISYNELEPYYTQAESLLGASGQAGDSTGAVSPARSAPYPLEAFPFTAADRPLIEIFEDLGISYGHMPMARFRKCMTTGTCRYCPFGARFTAAYILDELENDPRFTGFLLRTDSPCQKLIFDRKNRVVAVEVLSTKSGQTETIRGEKFIVASGAYESPKLLQRSNSKFWEDGPGNDYGWVGRGLISHPFLHVRAVLPTNTNRWNQELDFPTLMSRHYDTPREQRMGKLFLFKDRSRPSLDLAAEMINGVRPAALHSKSQGPMEMELQGFMEEFSSPRNRLSVADGKLNGAGLTQTKVDFTRSDDFLERAETRLDLMERIISQMGAKIVRRAIRPQRGDHAAATCRMGDHPETSVVDRDLRVHGVENLWVCSNAVFPTGGAVNPTLTLTSLAIRLAVQIAPKAAAAEAPAHWQEPDQDPEQGGRPSTTFH